MLTISEIKINEDDYAILKELQKDGRMSYADISRTTGIPDSTIYSKIQRLISIGVIKNFIPLLDEVKLGFTIIAIIGVETGAKLYKKVAEELCKIREVTEVYGTTAEYDLMIKIIARSRDDLSISLNKIRTIEGIDDIFVSSVLEIFKNEKTTPI